MEDEIRPLPAGWIRQLDYETDHQFFVDTRANPPRSTWDHPWDDRTYIKSIPKEERKQIVKQNRRDFVSTDAVAEKYDDGDDRADKEAAAAGKSSSTGNDDGEVHGLLKLGRRIKKKRQQNKALRDRDAARKAQLLEAHLATRRAALHAMRTGEPQFLRKDRDGKDFFIVPPSGIEQRKPVPLSAYGYNPYDNGDPNARFLRPQKKCKRSVYRYGATSPTYHGGVNGSIPFL
ncbi:putative ww rsp5 wwp [Diplodia seriata]|nr:putative ww rsp5 wwp [Diplodia seriata]